MDTIDLSVIIPTYNHESYICKTLDGVLNQKTQYTFEVLVGEDVSTDRTREILKHYEQEHPGRLQVFYREHNLGMSDAKYDNHMDLLIRAKGRYTIFLEGDDFWIDDHKIEKQIAFLDKNKDYIAVAHNCIVVDEHGDRRTEHYPECKDTEYTLKHYLRNILPGQLATLMFRNIYTHHYFDTDILETRLVPKDRLLYFTLLSCGKIYCMQEAMTAYRYVTSGGASYSANVRYDFFYDERWHKALYEFASTTKKETVIRGAELLYFMCVMRGIKRKQISLRQAMKYLENTEHRIWDMIQFISIYTPIILKKTIFSKISNYKEI